MSADDRGTPRVSIVLATFNAVRTLDACIRSIAAQSFNDHELVIIDGGSTDGTLELLRANDDRIAYWHSRPDDGIYDAWNSALEHVRGTWICFIGADDELAAVTTLERLAEAAETAHARDGVRLVYGRNAILDPDGRCFDVNGEPWEQVRARFMHEMVLPHPGMLHHRSLFDDHGGFDTSFRIAGDYDLLLRELVTRRAEFVPDVWVTRIGPGGVSRTWRQSARSISEAARARARNGIETSRRDRARIFARHWISACLEIGLGRRVSMLVKRSVRRLLGRARGPIEAPPSIVTRSVGASTAGQENHAASGHAPGRDPRSSRGPR